MCEVIGAFGERARHDDRGLDTPARKFAGVADGERIHRRLRREIRREIGWRATARAAAGYPHHEPATLFAQVWKGGAVDALCAEHIDVVELGKLFRRERLGWAE